MQRKAAVPVPGPDLLISSEAVGRYDGRTLRGAVIINKGESGGVLDAGVMLDTARFAPEPCLDRGKAHVAFDLRMYLGNGKPRGARHDLRVNISAAGDDDFISTPA